MGVFLTWSPAPDTPYHLPYGWNHRHRQYPIRSYIALQDDHRTDLNCWPGEILWDRNVHNYDQHYWGSFTGIRLLYSNTAKTVGIRVTVDGNIWHSRDGFKCLARPPRLLSLTGTLLLMNVSKRFIVSTVGVRLVKFGQSISLASALLCTGVHVTTLSEIVIKIEILHSRISFKMKLWWSVT